MNVLSLLMTVTPKQHVPILLDPTTVHVIQALLAMELYVLVSNQIVWCVVTFFVSVNHDNKSKVAFVY